MLFIGGMRLRKVAFGSIGPDEHCLFILFIKSMLSTLGKRIMLGRLITPLCYRFGGGHHHEIDYQAVVTKNQKSGTPTFISGYYMNPNKVARRISRIMANYDNCKNI